MGTRINAEADFAAAPSQVFALMTDPELLLQVASESDSVESSVSVIPGDREVVIAFNRAFEEDWPSLVAAFIGKRLNLSENRRWQELSTGFQGTFTLQAVGLPITMDSTVELVPTANGCHFELAGEIKSSVPLIGGSVESLAKAQLLDGIAHETEVISRALNS